MKEFQHKKMPMISGHFLLNEEDFYLELSSIIEVLMYVLLHFQQQRVRQKIR